MNRLKELNQQLIISYNIWIVVDILNKGILTVTDNMGQIISMEHEFAKQIDLERRSSY